MIKNQIINGTCVDYTYDGLGVVKSDTFCVFVKDMIVGENADIIITSVKKDYCYGKISKLIVASENRVNAACDISKPCGGCQLQHMNAKEQAKLKYNQVLNNIRRIAKLDNDVLPVLSMSNPFNYRNKVMLPVGKDKNGKTIIGFYRNNSHDIIDCHSCVLQSNRANSIINDLRDIIEELKLSNSIRHIMMRDMERTDSVMLVLVTYKEKVFNLDKLVSKITKEHPYIKSVIQNINAEETNVVLGKQEKLLFGKDYVEDVLCGLRFKISSHSFYQVNTYQTEVLYNKAVQLAQISKDDEVLDLYCGVGTIGMIASLKAKKVTGVEIVPEAIEDAKLNAKTNNITNIDFICGDASVVALDLKKQNKKFDVLFVDPPRKGCNSQALETILSFDARKVVYVSCNPATLARDLEYLKQFYNVEMIQPVDMFPHTHHCENIVLLTKK